MTKYYYTCPLKAAYMAKEFGVDFKQWLYPTIHSTKEELCNVSFLEIVREIEFSEQDTHDGKFRNRYIIASENQNIFEPKERDLDMFGCRFYREKWRCDNGKPSDYQKNNKIVFRDNKQFFMPEVEND